MLVYGVTSDYGLFWSFDETEHNIIIEDNYGGNYGNYVEGDFYQHESGNKDDDILENIEYVFNYGINLFIILSLMEDTWFSLSEMKGACVRVYHLMGLFETEVMAFS